MKKQVRTIKNKVQSSIDPHYRIGMRVVKTGILIMIFLAIAKIMNYDTNFVIIASSSAIITLRTSHTDTLRSGIFRILGTLSGAVNGIICVLLSQVLPYYSEGLYILIIPLIVILNLYICNFFKIQDTSVISCIVLILIAANTSMPLAEAMDFAINRLVDTLIGVTIATVFNSVFFPYREPVVEEENDEDSEKSENKEKNQK